MQVIHILALLSVAVAFTHAQGAGRAIPIASENFVIDLFKQINPDIEYDPTNFLVDLSGNYANCNFIGRRRHEAIDRRSPNGATIGLIQDYTRGTETHTKAVDNYIRPVFESWRFENTIRSAYGQIQKAKRFGCSVRPGCRGDVSVACLFSPYDQGDQGDESGIQRAKAFTPQQYAEAEQLTQQKWDRSHFLENLSGFETRCDMIGRPGHDFPYATYESNLRGKDIVGLYGWAPNRGSTPVALLEILENMKEEATSMLDEDHGATLASFFDVTFRDPGVPAKETGCSLIPDCIRPGFNPQMWVIVSCIFEI